MKINTVPEYDSGWITQLLSETFGDLKQPAELAKLEAQILDIIGSENTSQRDCEKRLLALLGHKNYTQVRTLLKQRP